MPHKFDKSRKKIKVLDRRQHLGAVEVVSGNEVKASTRICDAPDTTSRFLFARVKVRSERQDEPMVVGLSSLSQHRTHAWLLDGSRISRWWVKLRKREYTSAIIRLRWERKRKEGRTRCKRFPLDYCCHQAVILTPAAVGVQTLEEAGVDAFNDRVNSTKKRVKVIL